MIYNDILGHARVLLSWQFEATNLGRHELGKATIWIGFGVAISKIISHSVTDHNDSMRSSESRIATC